MWPHLSVTSLKCDLTQVWTHLSVTSLKCDLTQVWVRSHSSVTWLKCELTQVCMHSNMKSLKCELTQLWSYPRLEVNWLRNFDVISRKPEAKNGPIFLKINRLLSLAPMSDIPRLEVNRLRNFDFIGRKPKFGRIFASFSASRGPKLGRFSWKSIGFWDLSLEWYSKVRSQSVEKLWLYRSET